MQYSYIAIDQVGGKKKGILQANSDKEVLDFLRGNKLTPLKIKSADSTSKKGLFSLNKVKGSDIVLFTRQLSSMTQTGLTLFESLNILKDQTSKPDMKKLIEELSESVSEGDSFSKALSKHPKEFSEVYVALIQAAEKGGLLDKVLARLAENLEKSEDLKKHVKSAMFYPMIVISGVVGVIAIMNIFVIPQLGSLYENLNLDLPFTTKIVLGFSRIFQDYFVIVLAVGIGAIFAIRRYKKTPAGTRIFDKVKLKIPVLGPIFVLSVLDEITRTLSILISSGTSILEAINITSNVANNIWYKDAMKASGVLVEKGVSLSQALEAQNIFPSILVQMVRVGEATGRIDESLLRVAEYFERDLDLKVKTLTTAIEPILIIVLGVAVAFLIMSVITPIYSLISQIQ